MRSAKAKASQRIGESSEAIVKILLDRRGYRMIEHPQSRRVKTDRGWIFIDKLSGDFRAIQPGTGKSVLVEVKYRDRNLRPSDFEEHQITSLRDHEDYGGISIIAHVHALGVDLMTYSEFSKKAMR